jgi:hypothetical protein
MIYRGEAGEFVTEDLQSEGILQVAVSPYLSTFNEELKVEKNKVTQLYGEAMHEVSIFL